MPSTVQTDPPWRISIDTGGTFSDCIGIAPDGSIHRAKVLSTGALRAMIQEVRPGGALSVAESWNAPDAFVTGWRLRRLSDPGDVQVLAHRRDDHSTVLEVSSTDGLAQGDAIELVSAEGSPIVGVRLLTRTPANQPLPPVALRVATTRGTNALLERRAGPVVFFVTKGFADLLTIGTQQRPDIFAINITKPRPLYDAVVEVTGRLAASGEVLAPLDLTLLDQQVNALLSSGIRNAAIALMHAWIDPAHEQALAAYLAARGFTQVSCSHEMAPTIKILPRAQTAVVDAYLAPVIGSYLANIQGALPTGSSTHCMTSGGGLAASSAFKPKDSLLSGPAGGVVGAAAAANRSGFSRLITFDMGGTSTDVARFDGDHTYVFEHHLGDAHIVAPAVAVESVAAGGGSICWWDAAAGSLQVGPQSAGAHPGPACYGAGGPLTITDCNLLLGRLDPSEFGIPINAEAARSKAQALRTEVAAARGTAPSLEELLEGLLELADERMAQAIRTISIAKGYDPTDHVLVAFGGAGGQHACAVAERLRTSKVLIPQDVGLLSAKGLSVALIERFAQRQVLEELPALMARLPALMAGLEAEARSAVAAQGVPADRIDLRRRILQLRLKGQDASISIELAGPPQRSAIEEAFDSAYRSLYGYAPAARAIEVESVRVAASGRATAQGDHARAPAPDEKRSGIETVRAVRARFHGQAVEAAVLRRHALAAGREVPGPALILEAYGTTVVPPGWSARVDAAGAMVLSRTNPAERTHATAVHHELLTARLTSIATDMGETLRATALSTNIKERLDFSCAILDADAQLVVNAPHIPVHLGALGLSVRQLLAAIPMGPGDVVVTNHPGFGGSHLPDITVVTPVFSGAALLAYVASRAHHAEIGGARPGSMPPNATTLAEEGVVIAPMYLVKRGESRLEDFRHLITTAPYPTRQPGDNLADIQAQIAANHRGAAAIASLSSEFGAADLARAMAGLTDRAHDRTKAALRAFAGQTLTARETLDDGSPIQVSLSVPADGRAAVSFAGSAPTHPRNFNAPLGVVRSALMYVLRLLIDEPLPLNEGILRAIDLEVPQGMLNPRFESDPARCPAVAAGNCETSQRVVDALLKALGLAACSQGTMNNLIFGNARFGYYETICGGSGATPKQHGADAVHTHMTNTRITDPEILEQRFPVRLERFQLRAGSGGPGRSRGGDGAIREYTFLEPVSISLLTQHRVVPPYGTDGGGAGRSGRQILRLPDGTTLDLGPVESRDLPAGSTLTIETPGGGGWGQPWQPAVVVTAEDAGRA